MKRLLGKFAEWSASGIVGSLAFAAVCSAAAFLTGSWKVVLETFRNHPAETASCLAFVFSIGLVVGNVFRGALDGQYDESGPSARRLRKMIPDLHDASKAVLYCAYESADIVVHSEAAGIALRLAKEGFLRANMVGAIDGDHYSMSTELRSELSRHEKELEILKEAYEMSPLNKE